MLDVLFMIPVPFTDRSIPIYGYGFMLVIGFFAALEIAKRLGPRVGIRVEFWQNALLIALVTGVIGARLSHVLENIDVYTDPGRSAWDNFTAAINITSGGLTFYGGLILAALALVAFGLWNKIPLRAGLDVGAPAIMVGLAFGRIGCFLHGCCAGGVCEVPWAVTFPYDSIPYQEQVMEGRIDPSPALWSTLRPGTLIPSELAMEDPMRRDLVRAERSLPLHPTQLYSSFNALLLCALLLAYFFKPHAPGRVFALMLILNGGSRFILELLRDEPTRIGVFSFSMIVGPILVTLGVVLWFAFSKGKLEVLDAPAPVPV